MASIAQRDALSRRLSAALCVAMLAAFGWGLHRVTAGFEVWTFEGRRQLQLQTGSLRAASVSLQGVSGLAPQLWYGGPAQPAAYLVDFIYTRCPGVCRALGSEFQQLQRALAADPTAGAVHLVSISFDVAHDSAAGLAHYAIQLGAAPAWWTMAVPATADDATTLLHSLGVVAISDGQGGFVHNGAIHLLDAQGRLRGLFGFDQWPQALAAARQTAKLPSGVTR